MGFQTVDHCPVRGLVVYQTDTMHYSVTRCQRAQWVVPPSCLSLPHYLISAHSLSLATFSLSQEEFVSKVLMYGTAVVAESVCRLNHWHRCSLPINALETALELRQLDTVSFFLRSREIQSLSQADRSNDAPLLSSLPLSAPSLPPIPASQMDTAIRMLIAAIRKNYGEPHTSLFASQLLLMTLAFLTRMIKGQALLDEIHVVEEGRKEEEVEGGAEGEDMEGTEENEVSESARRRTVSGASAESASLLCLEGGMSPDDITSYIHQLRPYLRNATLIGEEPPNKEDKEEGEEEGEIEEVDSAASFPSPALDRRVTASWNQMDMKEVVRDALLRGCLPMAQVYLLKKKPDTQWTVDQIPSSGSTLLSEAIDTPPHSLSSLPLPLPSRAHVSLSSLLTTASGFVLEALEKRSINLAISLLTQMCMDVRSSLRHVCFHTVNRSLRDFLAGELISRQWLAEEEDQALNYLHILETYYTATSYEDAQALCSKQQARQMIFQSTVLPFVPGIVTKTTSIPTVGNLQELYPETFGGSYTISQDPPPSSSSPSLLSSAHTKGRPLYLQVPLCAVLTWDSATRQRLLFEMFVLSGQTHSTECDQLVKKDQVFDYHVRHNDFESSLRFIMSRVPPLGNPAPCPAHIQELCTNIAHSVGHMSNAILDELARQGVFLPAELQTSSLLLRRLGRIHTLFSHPHPLSKASSQGEIGEGVVSVRDFHYLFLLYCMKNKFASLMYHYLDYYSLAMDEDAIAVIGLDTIDEPWVEAMLKFRILALNTLDSHAMFAASLSCSRLLLPTPHSSVLSMLQAGRTLMALATLMYAPAPLEEVLSSSSSGQPWHADPALLRSAVAAYPTLQAALFPPAPTSVTPAQSQDITVYQLLQGSVPFDVSRLFRWQTTNTLAILEDAVEGSHDIPHFSQPALTERYAKVEHLTYIHYLTRGQPSFAFANFVAAKLIGRSNTSRRLDHAVPRVYQLALRDFSNSRLTSSCVAFLEMIGRDSRLLRIDVQVAVRISQYSPSEESIQRQSVQDKSSEEHQKNKKIALLFIQLHSSPEEKSLSLSLLSQLETATRSLISTTSLSHCSLEAEEQWALVQSFCNAHLLPPSTAFLSHCAEEGQWLPLLSFAQLYAIPPQKVLLIIEQHFSNPQLQEHLRLALSTMDTSDPSTPSVTEPGDGFPGRPKTRRRRSTIHTRMQRAENLMRLQPDLRAKLYSKIGLQRERTPQPESKASSEPTKAPSTANTLRATDVERQPALEEVNLPDDLFSVLFKCRVHQTPWRALLAHAIALQRPLLAILAACQEDAVMVDCMCVWLYCTLGCDQLSKATVLLGLTKLQEDTDGQMPQFNAALQWHRWSAHDLAMLLVVSLQLPPSSAPHFTLAFQYFDQNNPLLSFFKFHEQFTLYCNLEECKKYLMEFELCLNKCADPELGYMGEVLIGDVCWVERLANLVASHMLVVCPTPFERSHLLKLLHEASFGEGFQCSVLNFKDLHQMSMVLSEAGLPSDAAFTIREHFTATPGAKSLTEVYSVRVRVDSDRVLAMLLEKAQFGIARKYASIVGSTASEITVKEAEHNLKRLAESSYWQYEQARLNFWQSCNSSFSTERVDPELAAEFFESVVHHSTEPHPTSSPPPPPPHSLLPLHCTATERALLLAFALKWRKETDTMSADQLKEFEREIWLSHIHATVEEMNKPGGKSGSSPLPFLPSYSTETLLSSQDPSSLLSTLSITISPTYNGQRRLSELLLPDNVSVLVDRRESSKLDGKEEVEAFNMMLGRLLNAGYISEARELATLFEHDSPDLTIVLCCIQLAQGKLSTDQLTPEVLNLMSTHSPRHLSDLSLSFADGGDTRPSVEILRMMQKLSDRAIYAQDCCSCIRTCFKIAVSLRFSFASVVTTDPFSILTHVLSGRHTERYLLAKKFVSDCNLKSKEVAGYLSDCVAFALQSQLGVTVEERDSPKSRVYYVQMTSSQFIELAQLCPDHNEFGGHLLSMAKALASSQHPTTENLSVQVELLVRAHDCYTLGCSVDGISEVLLVVRQWVPTLMAGKQFSLMVRLLTGIGRFYEMSYILQLLMEHDQFESLLHTGMEKEEQLRVALMDYLCNHHQKDHEKMQMVALKFGMFHDLAKTKEEQAKRELKKIRSKQLATNNPETIKTLKTVFETLRTAAKTYAQEDCLSRAHRCYSLARLVALQLSVLQSGKQVINLDVKKVLKHMEELPFQEALIVADAYKRTSWTDWISPLYKKVIIGGNFRYLNDFKSAFPMKPSMFQELVGKYLHDREKTPESASNVKRLLSHLRNLPLKRKLAADLGFTDLLQSLSPTLDEGFLNDIARL